MKNGTYYTNAVEKYARGWTEHSNIAIYTEKGNHSEGTAVFVGKYPVIVQYRMVEGSILISQKKKGRKIEHIPKIRN